MNKLQQLHETLPDETVKQVQGRLARLFNDGWYIALSSCDGSFNMSASSVTVGKWRFGSRNQVVLGKALKRKTYNNNDTNAKLQAISDLEQFIVRQRVAENG